MSTVPSTWLLHFWPIRRCTLLVTRSVSEGKYASSRSLAYASGYGFPAKTLLSQIQNWRVGLACTKKLKPGLPVAGYGLAALFPSRLPIRVGRVCRVHHAGGLFCEGDMLVGNVVGLA